MIDIFQFLAEHEISSERFDHPAVFTTEEAERLCPKMPGISTKNLFLRDKNGTRFLMVVVGHDKSADLKSLAKLLGVSKLSFGSAEKMMELLGVLPGAVTLLGLVNDEKHVVEVIIDEKLWGQTLQCHPLVNTAHLVISAEGIAEFLKATGHVARILEVPAR